MTKRLMEAMGPVLDSLLADEFGYDPSQVVEALLAADPDLATDLEAGRALRELVALGPEVQATWDPERLLLVAARGGR